VARLVRTAGGAATPHPIAVTFPAATLVYPMKLTALAGSTTHVELFVVTPDRQATAAGFETILADRYQYLPPETGDYSCESAYRGTTTKVIIGSPEAQKFLWDDCVFTKLTADLSPGEMNHDIEIGLKPLVPQQKTYFSEKGRGGVVTLELLIGGALVAIVAAIIFRGRRRPSRRQVTALVTVGGLALMVALATFLALPVIPTYADYGSGAGFREYSRLHFLKYTVEKVASAGYIDADLTPAQWVEFPKRLIEKGMVDPRSFTNPLTGELMKYARTPGNFSSRQVGDDCYFCLYDLSGREFRVKIEPRAQPKAAD
jgi:hypothetical protein